MYAANVRCTEWRALVSKAAGRERRLDDLDADAAAVRKIRELATQAMSPVPARTAAPAGSVVLPAGVWEDVLAGRLLAIDVSVLVGIAFVFRGGQLHPQVEKRRDAVWSPDETLVVRDGLHRLLPAWSEANECYGDAVGLGRKGIEERLAQTGWLELDRRSPQEVTVRARPALARVRLVSRRHGGPRAEQSARRAGGGASAEPTRPL